MRIPTQHAHASMNLGQAVAVCLYELVRDTAKKQDIASPVAAAGTVERITHLLTGVLAASGYLKRQPAPDAKMKIRRLVRRLKFSQPDAELLLGMLRQIRLEARSRRREDLQIASDAAWAAARLSLKLLTLTHIFRQSSAKVFRGTGEIGRCIA
jgi:tRNA C32,U32 (ribose-2'-O)-methylase TrmJ